MEVEKSAGRCGFLAFDEFRGQGGGQTAIRERKSKQPLTDIVERTSKRAVPSFKSAIELIGLDRGNVPTQATKAADSFSSFEGSAIVLMCKLAAAGEAQMAE